MSRTPHERLCCPDLFYPFGRPLSGAVQDWPVLVKTPRKRAPSNLIWPLGEMLSGHARDAHPCDARTSPKPQARLPAAVAAPEYCATQHSS